MIQLGKKQKLQVLKKVDFGVYLGEPMQADVKEKVLLPIKQVPEQTKEGDILEVFSGLFLGVPDDTTFLGDLRVECRHYGTGIP